MKWHSGKNLPRGGYCRVFVIIGPHAARQWNIIECNHGLFGWRDCETKRSENWNDVLIWAHCHEIFDDAREAIKLEKRRLKP